MLTCIMAIKTVVLVRLVKAVFCFFLHCPINSKHHYGRVTVILHAVVRGD